MQLFSAPTVMVARAAARLSRAAESPLFPLMGVALALVATLLAVAFVPVLCALVALKRRHWTRTAIYCAIGSAVGATLMAWLVAQYGTQVVAEYLPGIARSREWTAGLRWVEQYGFLALVTVAGLPLSQTPVLIVCALLGMPPSQVFASVLLGKLVKYLVSAASAVTALKHLPDRLPGVGADRPVK